MRLWWEWLKRVRELRPACRRSRTFFWMGLVLAGLCTRPECAGITSFVRGLALNPLAYPRFLHLFHSGALDLTALTEVWTRLVLRLFTPLQAGASLVCLADGLKAPKEGKKMPAVKSLHQASETNRKPPYIMGHSLQALSLLVRNGAGHVAAVPLTARIHEGLVWSNRNRRTLLDKMVALFLPLTTLWDRPVLLVADAYYASRKVIQPLLAQGHHLVTRARINTVAYRPARRPRRRRRGRPRLYGAKVRLRDLARDGAGFQTAPSPLSGESTVQVQYRCVDFLWRPVGRLVRFVIVRHPQRGTLFLLATDLRLAPLDVIRLYSYRFKIEVGFRQAIQVLGSYAYHFWMKDMTPIRRRDGDQYLHRKSERYRESVRRKMNAYHRHVQMGCIAQGLLLHLALNHGDAVWSQFRSWLRTMDPTRPPSELVVSHALRDGLPQFLDTALGDRTAQKILARYRWSEETRTQEMTAYVKAG